MAKKRAGTKKRGRESPFCGCRHCSGIMIDGPHRTGGEQEENRRQMRQETSREGAS